MDSSGGARFPFHFIFHRMAEPILYLSYLMMRRRPMLQFLHLSAAKRSAA